MFTLELILMMGGGLPARTERVRSGGKTSATDIVKG